MPHDTSMEENSEYEALLRLTHHLTKPFVGAVCVKCGATQSSGQACGTCGNTEQSHDAVKEAFLRR